MVTVTAFNDEKVDGLIVPLKFAGTSLIPDSVSFLGTRLESASLKPVNIDTVEQKITFGAIYLSGSLEAGQGIIGKLFFTVKDSIVLEAVTIDTFIDSSLYLTFVYTDTNSDVIEFYPHFISGEITITEENLPPKFEPIGNSTVYEGES